MSNLICVNISLTLNALENIHLKTNLFRIGYLSQIDSPNLSCELLTYCWCSFNVICLKKLSIWSLQCYCMECFFPCLEIWRSLVKWHDFAPALDPQRVWSWKGSSRATFGLNCGGSVNRLNPCLIDSDFEPHSEAFSATSSVLLENKRQWSALIFFYLVVSFIHITIHCK